MFEQFRYVMELEFWQLQRMTYLVRANYSHSHTIVTKSFFTNQLVLFKSLLVLLLRVGLMNQLHRFDSLLGWILWSTYKILLSNPNLYGYRIQLYYYYSHSDNLVKTMVFNLKPNAWPPFTSNYYMWCRSITPRYQYNLD